MSRQGASQTLQTSSSKRVRICSGRMTRTLLIAPKPMGLQRALFDDEKKEQRQRRFKVAYPMNGGTLRWNVVATCAMCTTRWPKARQLVTKHTQCNNRWTFDPSVSGRTHVHPKASPSRSQCYSSREHTRPPRLSFALVMVLTMNAR